MSDASGTVNQEGVQYYKNLIAALKEANIQPMVTMYHWDLPQYLEDLGGFLNADLADWFEQYADLLYREYGADVQFPKLVQSSRLKMETFILWLGQTVDHFQ